jgi:uncharacterized protein YndB with AHSA1/START domain
MTYSSKASIVINESREKIWRALTIPEHVKKYFFDTNLVTDWKVGSPIYFRGEYNGKSYEDKGTVLEFSPMEALSYNYWSSFSGIEDKPELYQILRYTLIDTPEGIEVAIHQSNVATQESADHSSENWKKVLEGLKTYVSSL